MRYLEKILLVFMVLAMACFCPTEYSHGQTWDEIVNGGGDAGDFPAGTFQEGDGGVYDVLAGSLDPNGGDEYDSYLITVTDVAAFNATTAVNLGEDDTRIWLWDTNGMLVHANDDDPDDEGNNPPWLARISDPSTFPGTLQDNPGNVVAGTDYVLTLGGFNSDPMDVNGVDLANMDFGLGLNFNLQGINPVSDGVFFTWEFFGNAAGGNYEIELTGATLAGGGGGCTNPIGDVNLDGAVDLLDVAPFVALLTGGGFQCEADINVDGAVDLLDVTPFVDLLTGG